MNIYGYDEFGNPLYYEVKTGNSWSSVDDSIYAHIDGGKDNPGLFTAK